MKTLRISLAAALVALSSIFGLLAPSIAKADSSWPIDVLASSAQVRFEATPTQYDATTNKYKYKFSWLMPKYRTYSFLIDGKAYMPRVTQNGVVETPLWFSPGITYTIQIFPYANGKGKMLAQGSFTSPQVVPPKPVLTAEEEGNLVAQYVLAAPKLPYKTIRSVVDMQAITELLNASYYIEKTSLAVPYFSALSQEMLAQTPIFLGELDQGSSDGTTPNIDLSKIKIYEGGEYASLKYRVLSSATGNMESRKLIFIKENGQWKYDLIQMLKIIFEES